MGRCPRIHVVRCRFITACNDYTMFHTESGILSFTLNSEVVTEVSLGVLERFSLWSIIEGKVPEISGEPIKTQSECKQTSQNAGKRIRASEPRLVLLVIER